MIVKLIMGGETIETIRERPFYPLLCPAEWLGRRWQPVVGHQREVYIGRLIPGPDKLSDAARLKHAVGAAMVVTPHLYGLSAA